MIRALGAFAVVLFLFGVFTAKKAEARPNYKVAQFVARQIPRNSPDFDPDEDMPDARTMAKLWVPKVSIISSHMVGNFKEGPGANQLTFTFGMSLQNNSIRQIAEVDVACAMVMHDTMKEIFRSKSVAFKTFTNRNVPHVGAFEPLAVLSQELVGEFTVPSDTWRTDTTFYLKVTKMVPVADEHNLHDIGNLIDYVALQHTADVEKAIVKDPSLLKVHDSVGTTLSLICFAYGTPRLARFIIAHGGDIHAKASHNEDALTYAVTGSNLKMLDFALSKGFKVDPEGVFPLKLATMINSTTSIRWLIDHGANINRKDSAGFTPIAAAIYFGNLEAFNMIYDAKPDMHCHTNDGFGLIQLSVKDIRFLPKLLAAGVPVDDIVAKSKRTSLMSTAKYGDLHVAKWLLDHGANLKAKDTEGHDAFDYARAGNTLHTDRFFREAIGK